MKYICKTSKTLNILKKTVVYKISKANYKISTLILRIKNYHSMLNVVPNLHENTEKLLIKHFYIYVFVLLILFPS